MKELIKSVHIELTYQCNLRCEMCYVKALTKKENLPIERLKSTLSILKNNYKELEIYLTGGEPLLYKDFLSLIEFLNNQSIKYSILTNGTLLNELLVDKILASKPYRIRLSLDGLEKIHDNIRGVRGSFAQTIKSIKLLKKKNSDSTEIEINYTILPKNISAMAKMINLANLLGVSLRFQHTIFIDEKQKIKSNNFMKKYFGSDIQGISIGKYIRFGKEDVNLLIDKIKKIKLMFHEVSFFPDIPTNEVRNYYLDLENYILSKNCIYPFQNFRINPYGDIYPCYYYFWGNINNEDIMSILKCDKRMYFLNILNKNGILPGCIRCCKLKKYV